MRITGIRSRLVELPLDAPFRPAWGRGRVQTTLVLVVFEVGTDQGIVGLGAAHGGPEAQIAVDRFVTPHLIGQDPARIESLAGIIRDAEILGPPSYCMEIPLWDILGKAAGLPVSRLWGGASDRVRAYCSTGELRTPDERADSVVRLVEEGFTAVKLRFHHDDPRDDIAVAEAVRAAVGRDVELMVDANQAGADPGVGGHTVWDFRTALWVARELEQLEYAWLEEPLPRHDWTGLARLRDRLEAIKLAGGEDNHGLHEFRLLLERGCFDVLQPDAVKSETLSGIRHLAAFAGLSGVDVIPHTWGNGLGMLVHLHLAAALPNCGYLEYPHDPPSGLTAPSRDRMLAEPLTVDKEGYAHVPDRPGFGFLLDEDLVAHHTVHTIERGDCGFAAAEGSAT
ncbi:mandelate racemase/muconate lactonizing enzyme family protein [Streptomyces sp. 110]|uniref:Mandelate racemase/muconate lactonizing enzyme family protein n=1 Tax=Streptomyces endocoffeicus TaxID=2898945 RepID=A0ABS1Q2Z0_9ACTN|nr:mandelate racemase/muconate lactonizing enzyme family protein [Streptomyces endocoffeicus]MBL1118630.1 mandelate racemase/muconate lactonizing enzyme family protein [Streptomyces endocoffeicus]